MLKRRWKWLAGAACLLSALTVSADELPLSKGQALYLPIYSHIWYGDLDAGGKPMKALLSALVSLRNTSLKTPIKVTSARYYSTDGKLLKEFIPAPKNIPPMGTLELFVEKKESEGGSGANFVIQWEAAIPTNPLLVEAVHTDIQVNRSPAFVTTARAIRQSE
ncbi:MAG: DUF3124 domain-containing protein [Pseudomonadota bacterium]